MSIVKHRAYGSGDVKSISDGYIDVDFHGQLKQFKFPDVFDTFLTTEDGDLIQQIAIAKEKRDREKILHETIADAEKKDASPTPVKAKPSTNTHVFNVRPAREINNPLIGERAQTIEVNSEEELFELIGYIASPKRGSSFEAEVPKDGRDKTFEELFPGQTYRPIEMGDTPSGMPNKLSPQFRINFSNLTNCPDILRRNMGRGNGSCVGRINKSKFVIDLVQNYGFRFGVWQDISAIKSIAQKRGYMGAFDTGYSR